MKAIASLQMIDHIAAPVLVLNDEGEILHVNPAALALLEANVDDYLTGSSFYSWVEEGEVQNLDLHQGDQKPRPPTHNLKIKTCLGEWIPVSLHASRFPAEPEAAFYTLVTLNKLLDHPHSESTQDEISQPDLEWLADQGRVLLSLDDKQDILDTAGETLQQKLGDCIVVSLIKVDEANLRLEGVYGAQNRILDQVWKVMGGNLYGREFPVNERFQKTFSTRNLYKYPGGLADFAIAQVPGKLSEKLAGLVDVTDIYTIGLESNKRLLGCFYIFALRDKRELPRHVIEPFVFQTALALEKAIYSADLARSESKFQALFEHAPDVYFLTDSHGTFLAGNKAAEEITGYNRTEIIGKNMLSDDLLPRTQLSLASKLLARNVLGRSTGPEEFCWRHKNGSGIPLEIRTHPVIIDDEPVILGIARDISNRKKAEDQLVKAHNTLTRVLEGIDAHVYVTDMVSFEILYMNKRMIEDFGGNFTGKVCNEVFHDRSHKCSHCTVDQLLDSQGYPGEVVVWEAQNPKTGRWYKNFDRAIYWENQQLVKLQIAVDITDSVASSAALEVSENRYRNLFANSHTALMTLAPPEWDFQTGNMAMLELFQIGSRENLQNIKPWDLSPEFQPDGKSSKVKAGEMIQLAVETGSHFFEWTHKKINGDEFLATVQLVRVDLEDEYIVQATVRDISERIRSEKIMKQQMEELGLLNKLNEKANQGRPIGEILDLFGLEVKRFFNAINTHVYLLDTDQRHLVAELLSPSAELSKTIKKILGVALPNRLSFDLDQCGVYQQLIQQGEAQILTDPAVIQSMIEDMLAVAHQPDFQREKFTNLIPSLIKKASVNSVALVPIISEGTIIGLVDLVLPYVFKEKDLDVLRSITEQLSVILQRIRAEEARMVHLTENEFITRSLVQSARTEDIDVICSNLAENVHLLNPDSFVLVSLYDQELNSIRIRAVKGVGPLSERLVKILGKEPEEVQIDVSQTPLDESLNRKFTSGKLELIPGGLHDLTRGIVPKRICQSIESVAGVEDVYIAGFGLRGQSTGGLVLLMKKEQQVQFPVAIETAVSHLSVIFERRMARDEILRGKAQLESLRNVELKIASQLNLEELLETIAVEARSIVHASACGFSIFNPERKMLEVLAYIGESELPENADIACGEGFSGQVWKKKETLIVENYAEWEGRNREWAEMGNYHLAGIPVIWGDEVLGVLEIAIDVRRRFLPGDIETLELFATQAAIAVKNARLFNDEMMRRQEAETLREVGLLINRMMDRGDLLDMILSALRKVVPYHGASVQLVQGDENVVEAYHGVGNREDVVGIRYSIKGNRIAQEVVYEGKQIVLEKKQQIEEMLQGPNLDMIESWMAVPLEVKRKRIGLITLDHREPYQYTSRELRLVTDFATQAAIALENNRLFNEIRRRTQEIEVIYGSAMKLTQELQPELLFEHLYRQIESMFEQDAFILATYDGPEEMVEIKYATEGGVRQPQAESMRIPLEEKNSLLCWIIRKKTPLMIGNVETDTIPIQPQQQGKIIRSWLGVPLLMGDRVIGALVVQSYGANKYSFNNKRLLELLGNQVAIALENSRLFTEAQRRLSRLSSLREIDVAISGSVDLKVTMEVLIRQLLKSLNVDAACVFSHNSVKHTLDYVSGRGFQADSFRFVSLKVGKGLAGRAAQERSLVHIPDLREQHTSLDSSPLLRDEKFITYLAHPLIAKGELVGVLEVFNRERLDPDPEWINFLDALARVAGIAIDRLNLFNDLSRSNIELQQAYDATIEGWARAIEMRDNSTSEHSRRVVALTVNLARKLGIEGETLIHIRRGAMLHDIGKMAIPDGILLKTGKLDDDEWSLMKKHTQYAVDMLSNIDYLVPALDIPSCHHERWDGKGYPKGISGVEIPLPARIFAVVDVWDALQSDRPYRAAWSEEKAVAYLKDQAGSQFDPLVVNAFLDLIGLS